MFRAFSGAKTAGFEAAMEYAADAIVLTATDGTIQFVNLAFTSLTGYTKQEAIGQDCVLHGVEKSSVSDRDLRYALANGRGWHGERNSRRKDGSIYCEEMRVSPVHDAESQTVGFIAIKRDVTERRLKEEAQAFLAAIVESSEDAFVACTPEGAIRYWNRSATELFGYSAEELAGRPVSMLGPAERQATMAKLVSEVRNGNSVPYYDGQGITRDGRPLEIWVRWSPVKNRAGDVVGISLAIRENSKRRKAEKDLALFASIVESSEDAILAVELDGTIASGNKALEPLFGYSPDEVVGRHISILAEPGLSPDVSACLDTIRQGQAITGLDAVLVAKGGRRINVSLSISPIRDLAGTVVGASGIAHDISARQEVEQRLHRSEEQFRQVFQYAPVGMTVLDNEGRFARVNQALCQMIGYTPSELMETTWMELIHPDDLASSIQLMGELLAGRGVSRGIERRYIHRKGTLVWARIRMSAIPGPAGQNLHLVVAEDLTERKQAEEAARESEQRFRIMADSCPSPLWVTDTAGGRQYVNRAYREMCGLSGQDLEGDKWIAMLHADDADRYLATFRQAVAEHKPFSAEARVRRSDGAWRWVDSRAEPRFSPSGAYLGHVGMSPDITERKNVEAALRAAQEQYRMLAHAIESADECISITDTEERLIYANRALLRTYGYTLDELLGRNPGLFRSSRTPCEVEADGCGGNNGSWSGELWNRCKDGREFMIALSTSVILDEGGRKIATVGIARDITEQKQAELNLQRSQENFRQVAENIHEVFWIVSPVQNQVLYVSPAYERVWGRTCESLYRNRNSWFESVHPDDREAVNAFYAGQVRGESAVVEYRILTPNNEEQWIRDQSFPVRDEHNELVRLVGIAEQITDQKRYESELIRARQAADAANVAKGRFLANMSHELRTPMNGVIGLTELLLTTGLTGEQAEYVEMLQLSGKSLLAVINDVLDFSKIEAGKLELEAVDFDLREEIEGVIRSLKVSADQKGLEMTTVISPEVPPRLRGDSRRLRQILLNLGGNAVKFTAHGRVAIRVQLAESTGRNARLRFSVEDTGIGIAPDRWKDIFSPFTQADNSTTRKYGGTGLGLTISKELVELLGGTLGVESELGKGSQFWFTVIFENQPLRKPDISEPAARPSPQRPNVSAISAYPKLQGRILVADDNSTNRLVAVGILKNLGLRADAVDDGVEALAALRSAEYDVVLMDLVMPEMDGFVTTREIRCGGNGVLNPAIPIIAMTAQAMVGDRERCLEAGMNAYVSKPVSAKALSDILAKLLEPATMPRPIRPTPPVDGPIWDKAGMMERLDDTALARVVMEGYLNDIPRQIEALRTFVTERRPAEAACQAHAIKGASGNVGGQVVRKLAAEIEKSCNEGNLRLASQIAELETEFGKLKDAMKSIPV